VRELFRFWRRLRCRGQLRFPSFSTFIASQLGCRKISEQGHGRDLALRQEIDRLGDVRTIRCYYTYDVNVGWMDTPGESATQQKFHGGGGDWLAKAELAQPMGQLAKADRVAGLAAYLLSPESGVITGALIDYDQRVSGAYPE
jgi:NAD(P)-dependent dehydrogenase (short-subunit alcohol dehydrogenase family)